MVLLNTYDDKDEAEGYLSKISGDKRLASERDSTLTIYNLFGIPTWSNFYKLDLFNLAELQQLLLRRNHYNSYDSARHREIINILIYVSNRYGLSIPDHWN